MLPLLTQTEVPSESSKLDFAEALQMPEERRSIDAIVEELTASISQRSSEVDEKFKSLSDAQAESYAQRMRELDAKFKSLSEEQAKNFSATIEDWEKRLKATASAADRHLEASISRIEKKAVFCFKCSFEANEAP